MGDWILDHLGWFILAWIVVIIALIVFTATIGDQQLRENNPAAWVCKRSCLPSSYMLDAGGGCSCMSGESSRVPIVAPIIIPVR